MATKVITGVVRFSYVNLWTPTSFEENGEKKYNVSLLIPKKDKKTVAAIEAAIEIEKQKLLDTLNLKVLPKTANVAELRDGDEEYPEDENMTGMYFIRVSSKTKPGITEKNHDTGEIEEILQQDEFYSGCYGKASINAYAFGDAKKPYKGVALGINNVMKTKDGEHLGGGRSSAQEDFADDDDLL